MSQQKEKSVKGIVNRHMPSSLEAEQAVICSAMIDSNAVLEIMGELQENDFYSEAHRNIFSVMSILHNSNCSVDFVTTAGRLEAEGKMDLVGGINYLTTLNSFVPSAANYKHYIEIVKRNAIQRRLIHAANKIIDAAYNPFDPDSGDFSVLQLAESEIFKISQSEDKSTLANAKLAFSQTVAEIEQYQKNPLAFRGIPTPFSSLNRMINGLNKGDLIIIAARPGMGKTSLAMNLIEHAIMNKSRKDEMGNEQRLSAAVFSIEMGAGQLIRRMISSVSGISMKKIWQGALTSNDWKKIIDLQNQIYNAKLFLDESSGVTPMDILSKCRRLKREHGLDLVMIDYLQLMEGGGRRYDSKANEIADITRKLKLAAKELNVPVILLSQVNREIEKRGKSGDRMPQLSDLKESSAIEQDADIVMFIDRDYMVDENTEVTDNKKCKLYVSKNRNGETGFFDLVWEGEFVRFKEKAISNEENS